MPNELLTRRIAMWSGPRNISTALLRSWGNRSDTVVVDEPFYAFYLQRTGKDHPAAASIMTSGQTDWRAVVAQLSGAAPSGWVSPIFYQKQMTHHLLPEVDREWLRAVTNCFLIREPREVITSYIKRNGEPTLADLGFVQQTEIFDWVRANAVGTPPVIDARDVLRDPERIFRLLCHSIELEFDPAMLSWPPGPRATDGVWSKYWYDQVEKSTSFQPYVEKNEPVPERLREVYAQCRECYERLYDYRLH